MKKKTENKPADTLAGLFESILANAKSNAAAGEALGKYLMELVGGIGLLTNNLTKEIDETLAALDKEMEGKKIMEASSTALRLGGRAQGLAWVAGEITAMVDKLKEAKNETIH